MTRITTWCCGKEGCDLWQPAGHIAGSRAHVLGHMCSRWYRRIDPNPRLESARVNLKGAAQVSPARAPGSTAAGATLSFWCLLPYLTLMTTCYCPQFSSEEIGTGRLSALSRTAHSARCELRWSVGLCASHHWPQDEARASVRVVTRWQTWQDDLFLNMLLKLMVWHKERYIMLSRPCLNKLYQRKES